MIDLKKAKLMLVNTETEDAIYLPITNFSITGGVRCDGISITSELTYIDNGKTRSILRALGFV